MRNGKKLGATLTTMAAALVLAGCASSGDLQQVKTEVSELRAMVEAAQARAAAAESSAAQCTQICEATNEKVDRMFQQSLRK